MNKKLKSTLSIIRECYEALDDKKAIDIQILKVGESSSITDYLVIATGTSEPHLRALKNALEENLEKAGLKNLRVEYQMDSGWIVIDGFDFMIHLFVSETRNLFGLEKLWKDAERINLKKLDASVSEKPKKVIKTAKSKISKKLSGPKKKAAKKKPSTVKKEMSTAKKSTAAKKASPKKKK